MDLTPRQFVDDHLKVEFIGYDQRHWNSEICGWGPGPEGRAMCCAGIIPGRLCIQEELKKVTGVSYHYGAGDTVGVHMLALAVITGLNPIYVTGIDLDYTDGYVNNDLSISAHRIQMGITSMNKSPAMVDRVLEDITTIRNAAANIGVEIYVIDKGVKIESVLKQKNLNI